MKRSALAGVLAALLLSAGCAESARDDGNTSGDSNPDNQVDQPADNEGSPTP